MKTETVDEIFLRRKLDAYSRRNMQGILQFTPRDQSSYQPTYEEIWNNSNSHRYHGYPEHNFLKTHQPVTGRDATDQDYPQSGANIPYGVNVPITQTEPRPYAGALHERSSAEHRKFRRHQLEAEQDLLLYKNEKMKQLSSENEEKKRDMQLLMNYDPYGKPGCGAPLLAGHKKSKFLADDSTKDIPMDYSFNFGRPGAGAPLRTDSGRIKTEIAGDPLIRMHQGKTLQDQQAIKESMRYVTNRQDSIQYQKVLDRQVADRAMADQESRLHELRAEMEMLRHDPFGKPGAGAPNKSQLGDERYQNKPWHLRDYEPDLPVRGRTRAQPYGNTHHDKVVYRNGSQAALGETQSREVYPVKHNDWDKGSGYPEHHSDGNIGRTNWSRRQFQQQDDNPTDFRIGDLPRPDIKARLPITMSRNDVGDVTVTDRIPGQEAQRPEAEVWHPFGRAGAGAPLVDDQGNPVTTVYGRMHHERDSADQRRKQRAAREYISELQSEMLEQKRNRDIDRDYQRAPVGELARVITEGQVGRPRRDPYTGLLTDQHMRMTDVTKHRFDHRNQKSDESRIYHSDLSRAAEERYRNRELEKLKEKQRSQQHQQVMNGFWGRPGGGAPNPIGPRYHDVVDSIHSPRRETEAPKWEDTKNLTNVTKPPTADEPLYSNRADAALWEDYYGRPKHYETQKVGNLTKTDDDSSWKFKVRDTTNSTHKNQYEYDVPREPLPKKYHKMLTPYAVA